MTDWLPALRTLDAAMGTALHARGAPLDAVAAWTLTHPEEVRAVHASHIEAGAEAVRTNTFAAGAEPELAVRAVTLAREAGARRILGSLGPTAALDTLAPALRDAGVDALMLETFLSVGDGEPAFDLLRAVERVRDVGLPVIASLCPLQGNATDDGGWAARAVRLRAAGADALALGCGAGPASLLPAARIWAATGAPLYLLPNAGLPGEGAPRSYPHGPDAFAEFARAAAAAGATGIGGCCGSTAVHLRAAREAFATAVS